MAEKTIQLNLTVADVLARWPETAAVFLKHKTACVGCTMAPFETLQDVVVNYDLSGEEFLQELSAILGAKV